MEIAFASLSPFYYKTPMVLELMQPTDIMIRAGRRLDSLGLAPATSGNYSLRLDEKRIAITISGAHKGQLQSEDIMKVDLAGNPLEEKKPSAETLLHCVLYALYPDCRAVLHTHSVACSVLTRANPEANKIVLRDYEMLKAYPGVDTHETSITLPIFDNSQDMVELSKRVEEILKDKPETPAYLIRGHGIYGWGRGMDEALRVIEATEMLLSCEMHSQQIKN